MQPAARGPLGEGVDGVVGQLAYTRNKTFRFHVALTEVPAATAFAPRVFCIRRGRSTRDDEFYGFEARHSKLWTESTALNERYEVATSPYQDPNWLRQLFSPGFVDWLGTKPPADFSFELAYGALLGSDRGGRPRRRRPRRALRGDRPRRRPGSARSARSRCSSTRSASP